MYPYQSNSQKISLQQLSQAERFSFSHKPVPSLRNHITWEDDPANDFIITKQCCKVQNNKPRRRKIFQNLSPQPCQPLNSQGLYTQESRSPYRLENQAKQLRKNKSERQFLENQQFSQQNHNIDTKIDQINKRLQSHRSSKNNNNLSDTLNHTNESFRHVSPSQVEDHQQIQQLEKKLSESTFLLNKHEEVLHQKLPAFEKKLDQNGKAISDMQNLIKAKIELDKKRNNNLHELAHMTDSRLKSKEDELTKINSSLLQKQIQLLKNKEQNKKRQLQLIRIKRIEDLQKNNLQLYQAIERKKCFGQFQSLVENKDELIEGKCWDDESEGSKLRFSPQGDQSTIRYETNHQDVSANNTIGQILSPLVLSQYQYCL